ncbi:MAG: DUF6364 family protein [Nitrospiraceae bacterium]|nr:DUF6364 family protein [Nitrospiraceae bacterium]
MQTKLTLRLDETLIKKAKKHARDNGKSLSQVVSEYFSLLDQEKSGVKEDIPPLTKRLIGILDGSKVDEKDYIKYLEEKYP